MVGLPGLILMNETGLFLFGHEKTLVLMLNWSIKQSNNRSWIQLAWWVPFGNGLG